MYSIMKNKNRTLFCVVSFAVTIIGLFSYFILHELICAGTILLCGGDIIGVVPVITDALIYTVDKPCYFIVASAGVIVPMLAIFALLFVKKHHADAFAYGMAIACVMDMFLGILPVFWGMDTSIFKLFDFALALKYTNTPFFVLCVFVVFILICTFLCAVSYERFCRRIENEIYKRKSR